MNPNSMFVLLDDDEILCEENLYKDLMKARSTFYKIEDKL